LGRLVLNHSTNIEGLIPILQKLALNINIKTVTPAVISRVRGRSSKLIIRLSVKTINGYKAIARKGKTAQEVFISTELSKDELKKWVDYALQNKSLILFDAAYEAFIQDNDIPHSIYEIEGAKDCAIEFRSFSKNAGFTGVRCAFTVIPKNLKGLSSNNEEIDLWPLWNRRQATKFNGVSYIVQRGAEAVYSLEGKKEVRELIDFYMENAKIMKNKLQTARYKVYGGDNAPYIWIKVPDQMTSWDFFDFLLQKVSVVGTPGSGFGLSGEGYFRLSAFNSRSNVIDAMERIINI